MIETKRDTFCDESLFILFEGEEPTEDNDAPFWRVDPERPRDVEFLDGSGESFECSPIGELARAIANDIDELIWEEEDAEAHADEFAADPYSYFGVSRVDF